MSTVSPVPEVAIVAVVPVVEAAPAAPVASIIPKPAIVVAPIVASSTAAAALVEVFVVVVEVGIVSVEISKRRRVAQQAPVSGIEVDFESVHVGDSGRCAQQARLSHALAHHGRHIRAELVVHHAGLKNVAGIGALLVRPEHVWILVHHIRIWAEHVRILGEQTGLVRQQARVEQVPYGAQVVQVAENAQGVRVAAGRQIGVLNQAQVGEHAGQKRVVSSRMVRALRQFLVQHHLLVARQALVERRRLQHRQLLRISHAVRVGFHVRFQLPPARIHACAACRRTEAVTRFRALFGAGRAVLLLDAQAKDFPQSRVAVHLGVLRVQLQAGVVRLRDVHGVDLPRDGRVRVDAGVDLACGRVVLDGLEGQIQLAQVHVRSHAHA